ANSIAISSTTGVATLNFGALDLITTGTLGAGAITGTSLTDGTATLTGGALTVKDIELVGDAWAYLDIRATGANNDPVLKLHADSDYWSFHNDDSASNILAVRYNNVARFNIDTTGRVGIMDVTPAQALDVAGNVRADGFIEYSPVFVGGGIEAIKKIKEKQGTKKGDWAEIDHSTLPEGVKTETKSEVYLKNKKTGEEIDKGRWEAKYDGDDWSEDYEEITKDVEGRSLSGMVQVLLKAVQELAELSDTSIMSGPAFDPLVGDFISWNGSDWDAIGPDMRWDSFNDRLNLSSLYLTDTLYMPEYSVISDGSYPSIDPYNRILYDGGYAKSIDYEERILSDSSEDYALSWEDRQLIAVSGSDKKKEVGSGSDIILDWNTAGTADFQDSAVITTGIGTFAGLYAGATPGVSCTDTTVTTINGIVIGCGASDIRFKEDVEPIGSVLDKLTNIRGVYYSWNDIYKEVYPNTNTDSRKMGIVAQELQEQFPELVVEQPSGFLSIDYTSLTAVLLEGIKELSTKVNSGGAVGTGQISGVNTSTIIDSVKSGLVSLGIVVERGIVKITELAVEKFNAKTARMEEMEMVDRTTGEIWCAWIENGEWKRVKGDCALVAAEIALAPEIIPAPTPSSETAPASEETPVSEAEIIPFPETAPTPTPASETESEPVPVPEIEPTPAPAPETELILTPEVVSAPAPAPAPAPEIEPIPEVQPEELSQEEIKKEVKREVKQEIKQELKNELKKELKSTVKNTTVDLEDNVQGLQESVEQVIQRQEEVQVKIEEQSQQQQSLQEQQEQIQAAQEEQPASVFETITESITETVETITENITETVEAVKETVTETIPEAAGSLFNRIKDFFKENTKKAAPAGLFFKKIWESFMGVFKLKIK
ncbi:tail fiber domain-containing protein, partial [Patescibacteria group bacterium]|nr:tail fiber domain-containing protein [Patescibacteria group bacterium]